MSLLSARFFSFVQATPFYRKLHREAVGLLPPGEGRTWLDVGCGPGLVALLAAERGYRATGVDIDPAMIQRATRHARQVGSSAKLQVAGLQELPGRMHKADVVSAASLLAMIEDRAGALQLLLSVLSPSGALLLIEPSETMKPGAGGGLGSIRPFSRDYCVLSLWAGTRVPARAVGWRDLRIDGYETQCHELLEGLVNAWIIRATV